MPHCPHCDTMITSVMMQADAYCYYHVTSHNCTVEEYEDAESDNDYITCPSCGEMLYNGRNACSTAQQWLREDATRPVNKVRT
jgi:hypothetical protein